MNTTLRYGVAALVCGVVAGMFFVAGRFEHHMAQAQLELAALDLSGSAKAYEQAAQYLEATPLSGWLLDGIRAELVAKRAQLRYFQADYNGLVTEYANVSKPGPQGSADLAFTVANAAYRAGQHPDATREELLNALDRSIGFYLQVLQRSGHQVDAAFNYEHAIRLRDELAASDEWAARPPRHPFGRQGSQPLDMEWDVNEIKIFVPMEHDFREETEDPTIGGGQLIRRRG